MDHLPVRAFVVIASLLSATGLEAATWNVPTHAPTIQSAIGLASPGDTVEVEPGTYTGPGNRDVDFGGKGLVLRSLGGADATIIDCEGAGRGLIFQTGEDHAAIVEGFTITNGRAAQGGAIRCIGASPLIQGCVLVANDANETGGAIACGPGAAPRLVGCRIEDNAAFFSGGGISCINASPEIVDCLLSGNSAGLLGGGIYCREASPPMTECRIVDNLSNGAGGGLVIYHLSAPVLTRCVVAGNRGASNAGGAFCDDGAAPTLVECVVTGNQTDGSGGGLFCTNRSAAAIQASTVSGNRALQRGGGLYAVGTSSFSLERSILWGNCSPIDDEAHVDDAASQAFFSCSDVDSFGVGGAGPASYTADNVFADPSFCSPRSCAAAPTSEGIYGLDAASPCLADASPCGVRIGALDAACGVADVPPNSLGHGGGRHLSLSPSPFRDGVLIRYSVPGSGPAHLVVYDLFGRAVRSFRLDSPVGSLYWDGHHGTGRSAPPGMYFICAVGGGARQVVPVTKVR